MHIIKNMFIFLFICFLSFFILFPLFSQNYNNNEEELSPQAIARIKYEKAADLYKEGEYEKSLNLVNNYLAEIDTKKIFYPDYIKAKILALKAILIYAFREDGYEQKIEDLFIKAVILYLDLEIVDVAQVPLTLVDIFNQVKNEYLSQYAKTTRRNSLGFVTTLQCTVTEQKKEIEGIDGDMYTVITKESTGISIQPGIHYAFNITEFLSVNADIKFPVQDSFWNFWRLKAGVIWFPDFRIEQLAFGIGSYYILTIDNWAVTKNSISFCGHGEFLFRMGIGIAADIEVFRFDINIDPDIEIKEKISPIGLGNAFQLFFANIDLYVLLTF